MNKEQEVLRIIAFLLHYPSLEWRNNLDEILALIDNVEDVQIGSTLKEFVAYLRETDAKEYEDLYVRSFDFSKNTNLYLTTHDATDVGKQAKELVEYKSFFTRNDFEIDKEMPDFLPAILELTSVVKTEEAYQILEFAKYKIELLRSRLIEAKLPHAFLLDLVLTIHNRMGEV